MHASPEDLLASVEGRVWTWMAPAAELATVRREHHISSAVRRGDGVLVRALSEARPSGGASPAPPTLEDAYLGWLARDRAESLSATAAAS